MSRSPNRVPHQRRPFLRVGPQPLFKYLADLVRLGYVFLRLSEPNHLDGRLTARFLQPYIDEIQLEHAQQRVEQGMNNLGWLTAAPHGRKSEDANQIINAALKALDFLCRISGLHIHISGRRRRTTPASPPLAKFSQELIRRHKERILLKDAADDDHGMRPHDVNHRVASKTARDGKCR